jgi:hypothetical protein
VKKIIEVPGIPEKAGKIQQGTDHLVKIFIRRFADITDDATGGKPYQALFEFTFHLFSDFHFISLLNYQYRIPGIICKHIYLHIANMNFNCRYHNKSGNYLQVKNKSVRTDFIYTSMHFDHLLAKNTSFNRPIQRESFRKYFF